jgi:hypothetical protein
MALGAISPDRLPILLNIATTFTTTVAVDQCLSKSQDLEQIP